MAHYPDIKELGPLSFKERWHRIIFEADTKQGRRFDILLLWAILLSVLAVMATSVGSIYKRFGLELDLLEYCFTVIFTLEYGMRIYLSPEPRKYIFSFWGIIDLLATIPTYLSFFVHGPQFLLMIRVFRLLRVFRVLRLTSFTVEAESLVLAMRRSGAKIVVFFVTVLIIVIVMGTLMYMIEPPEAGFSSIPRSVYWAIVTLTTVGYGDIAPVTALGQFFSAMLMILGYAVIAVPTGIVSVEFNNQRKRIICPSCGNDRLMEGAKFCSNCGHDLTERSIEANASKRTDSRNE